VGLRSTALYFVDGVQHRPEAIGFRDVCVKANPSRFVQESFGLAHSANHELNDFKERVLSSGREKEDFRGRQKALGNSKSASEESRELERRFGRARSIGVNFRRQIRFVQGRRTSGSSHSPCNAGRPSQQLPSHLFFIDDDVVDFAALRVGAIEGDRSSFAVFRDHPTSGHHRFAILGHRGLDRVGVNALDRDHVRVRHSGDRIVLARQSWRQRRCASLCHPRSRCVHRPYNWFHRNR
jgi:hypothetical protein